MNPVYPLAKLLLGGCLIVGLGVRSLSAQGTLSDVRETVSKTDGSSNQSESGKSSYDHSHADHHDDDDDDSFRLGISWSSDDECEDDADSVFAKLFLVGVTAPFWGPASAVENRDQIDANFDSFPYNHTDDGYMMFGTLLEESHRNDSWALRLMNEYGTDFDQLHRYGGRLFVETSSRWGVDTEWNQWREDLGMAHDELWTGDVNLIYRFAQSESAQFYTGLGLNWLADDQIGSENGFNFTYGFDFYPGEPFVLSTNLDWGRIDSSTLFHVRSTAGVVYEHVELFAGYDYREIDDVDLSGFVTGLTFWW